MFLFVHAIADISLKGSLRSAWYFKFYIKSILHSVNEIQLYDPEYPHHAHGTQFTKDLGVHNWILVKTVFALILILIIQSYDNIGPVIMYGSAVIACAT